MSKKIEKEIEKEEEEKEEEEEEEGEEGADDAEKKAIDAEVNSLASKIEAKLGLANVKKLLDSVKNIRQEETLLTKIFGKEDVSKEDVKNLSKEEKIVGFFLALVKNDKIALKALSHTSADGGYLVPDEFRAELIRDLEEPTTMRSLVRTVPMLRNAMNIPTLTAKPKVYWTAENTQKTTTSAEFGQKTLTAYKVAAILYASEELVEDAYDFNIVQLIIGLFSEALREEEDRVMTIGSGSGQPTGIANCSITAVTCSGNLDFDDIINLFYKLPAKYRKNATFLVNNANITELRKVKDSNGRYIWQEPLSADQPATILGRPVIENNWVSDAEIYFGDFKQAYWLGDRRAITVTISNEAGNAWEHDQVGIRVVERIGGTCVLENALRVLNTIP